MSGTFKYASNKEFFKALKPEIVKTQELLMKKRLTGDQLIEPYLNVAECKRLQLGDDQFIIMYPDYDAQTYVTNDSFLPTIISKISKEFGFATRLKLKDIPSILAADFTVDTVVQQIKLPDSGLIEVKNGLIYDAYSHAIVDRDPSHYYHVSYDIDPFAKPNTNSKYRKALEHLYQTWAGQDPELVKVLKLLTCLAVLGYGANSWFFLIGPGGNGKSTFIKLLTNLAGKSLCSSINMNELMSHDNLARVRSFDKIIYGHELPADYQFTASEMASLKMLTTGEQLSAYRKYLPSVPVYNRGLKLQATNYVPHFYRDRVQRLSDDENSALDTSVVSRFMFVKFGTTDHRTDFTSVNYIKDLTGYSVDKLIENKHFLNEVLLMMLQEFSFSSEQDVLEAVSFYKQKFDKELRDAVSVKCETVESFFNQWYKDGLFTQAKVPIAALYYRYCKDRLLTNSSVKVVSLRNFTKTIQSIAESYSLKVSDERSVVSTTKLRMCNLRELFYGCDLTQYSQFSDEYKVLKQKCYSVVNENPTSFFYKYTLNHNDVELVQLMNELAIYEDTTIENVYAMSQREIEDLYTRYIAE